MYTTLTIALLNNAIHSKVDSLAQKCPSSELVDKQFFWQTASHFKGMKAAVDVDAMAARLIDARHDVVATAVIKRWVCC